MLRNTEETPVSIEYHYMRLVPIGANRQRHNGRGSVADCLQRSERLLHISYRTLTLLQMASGLLPLIGQPRVVGPVFAMRMHLSLSQ